MSFSGKDKELYKYPKPFFVNIAESLERNHVHSKQSRNCLSSEIQNNVWFGLWFLFD